MIENPFVVGSSNQSENEIDRAETSLSNSAYFVKENSNASVSHIERLSQAIQNRDLKQLNQQINKINLQYRHVILNQINPDTGLSLLHLACRNNFEQACQVLMDNGADVSLRDKEEKQPVHYAAKFHRLKRRKTQANDTTTGFTKSKDFHSLSSRSCLSLVLKNGGDVNARDCYQATPLHYACAKGHLPAVEMCLNTKKSEVEALDDHRSNCMHEAAKNGHSQVVEALLTFCAGKKLNLLEQKDVAGFTPLMYSCRNGYTKIADAILKASNWNTAGGSLLRMLDQDLQGNTSLHVAVDGGCLDTVKLLLETWKLELIVFQKAYGYSISEKPYIELGRKDGCTAFHLAAHQGSVELLELLLKHSAAIDQVNEENESALFLATAKNHFPCVQTLLKEHCNTEIRNQEQLSAFLVACKLGYEEIASVLIVAGTDVTVVDKRARNCFMLAAENGNSKTLQILFDIHDSFDLMNDCDYSGNTALHEASANGHLATVKMLVERGMQLNVCNDSDSTALHVAAVKGHTDVVVYIVETERARLNDIDDYSRTPLYFAASTGNLETLKTLIEMGAKSEISDTRSWTPLHVCAWKGSLDCAEILLKTNPSSVRKETQEKETALHLACMSGSHRVVELLLRYNSDVTARRQDGRNALDVAIDVGNEDCVKTLLEHRGWKESLRNATSGPKDGYVTTPLRKMLKTMPKVAESVLTKCISNNNLDVDDKNLEITFHYELIEDMYECVFWRGEDEKENLDANQIFSNSFSGIENQYETEKYRIQHISETSDSDTDITFTNTEKKKIRKEARPYSKSSSILYENHPLKLMADSKLENLLLHPTVTSLLSLKWKKYGQKFYLANLLCYALYLSFLNYYVLSTPPRFAVNETSTQDIRECVVIIPEEQPVWGSGCQVYTGFRFVAIILVQVFSSIQLFKELIQLLHQRFAYFLEYTNYIEIALYSLSIAVFLEADPLARDTGLRTQWQWEMLSFVILLSWVNMLLYIRKSPLGLYVLMIEHVAKSFAKFGLIVMFFLVGFSCSFYVLLQNQFVFDAPLQTWIKTLVMMTGEYDYQTIFFSHFTSDDYQDQVEYETTTYFIFVIFVLAIGLLISNLLVGIAVDDISLVQDQATLKRLAIQVDSVLNLEYALPSFIRRRMVAREYTIKPNRIKRSVISEWLLSEEYVNLKEYLTNLRQQKIGQKLEKERSTFKLLESVKSTLKEIVLRQTKVEKQLEDMKTDIGHLNRQPRNVRSVLSHPTTSHNVQVETPGQRLENP